MGNSVIWKATISVEPDLAGHHEMLEDPTTITNKEKREIAINSHFQACPSRYRASDNTGDVWSATLEGGGLVRLTGLVESQKYILRDDDGSPVTNAFLLVVKARTLHKNQFDLHCQKHPHQKMPPCLI